VLCLYAMAISVASYRCSPAKSANVRKSSLCATDSSSKPLSDGLQRRLESSTLTANDLERAFSLTKKEIDRILLPSSKGFTTFIFGLEGGLLDMDAIFYQAYAVLASSGNLPMPTKGEVRDTIGSSFQETRLAFGWDLPDSFEAVFLSTLEKLMEPDAMGTSMTIQPGAVLALERAIQGGNTIIVNTALPRHLATKALGITRLSSLLAANVNPDNLIHAVTEDDGTLLNAERRDRKKVVDGRWQLIKACAQARTSPMLGMLVDSSRRNLLQAKRVGLSTMGVRGYALHAASLNSCDKVLASLLDFNIEDSYAIVRRHAELTSGLKELTSSADVMLPPDQSRQKTAAPAEDDPRAVRDTFAGNDKSSDVL
jgi:beta-phosphoglucomutase-like phosphatase (HAD superfamily)